MATAPPNTNKERARGISLFATKVFFSEGISPWLRLLDVIPISEPSIACFFRRSEHDRQGKSSLLREEE